MTFHANSFPCSWMLNIKVQVKIIMTSIKFEIFKYLTCIEKCAALEFAERWMRALIYYCAKYNPHEKLCGIIWHTYPITKCVSLIKNSVQYTFYDLPKVCKVFKKITGANARKIDKKFACKNPHFDFHAGHCTSKTRHAKAAYVLKITHVALVFPRVDKIGKARWGKLKK